MVFLGVDRHIFLNNLRRTSCLPSSVEFSVTSLYAQLQAAFIPSEAYLQKGAQNHQNVKQIDRSLNGKSNFYFFWVQEPLEDKKEFSCQKVT